MRTLTIEDTDFNKMTKKKLKAFVLVSTDGSDQCVFSWDEIVKSVKEDNDIKDKTNTQILDIFYQNDSFNGNNTSMLFCEKGEIMEFKVD